MKSFYRHPHFLLFLFFFKSIAETGSASLSSLFRFAYLKIIEWSLGVAPQSWGERKVRRWKGGRGLAWCWWVVQVSVSEQRGRRTLRGIIFPPSVPFTWPNGIQRQTTHPSAQRKQQDRPLKQVKAKLQHPLPLRTLFFFPWKWSMWFFTKKTWGWRLLKEQAILIRRAKQSPRS